MIKYYSIKKALKYFEGIICSCISASAYKNDQILTFSSFLFLEGFLTPSFGVTYMIIKRIYISYHQILIGTTQNFIAVLLEIFFLIMDIYYKKNEHNI